MLIHFEYLRKHKPHYFIQQLVEELYASSAEYASKPKGTPQATEEAAPSPLISCFMSTMLSPEG